MYVRFNGNFEVFDDNNEMITKKKMDIIGSEFYPAEDIPNRIWSPKTIQLSDDLLLEYEITIQSKLRSKK
jgi:hypothetical protein